MKKHLDSIARVLRRDDGAAGLIIAMVVAIIAFSALAVFFGEVSGPARELAKLRSGKSTTQIVNGSLEVYWLRNQILPCPDTDFDGDASDETCTGTDTAAGTLPWSTLGISTMFDGSDLGAKYADIFLDVNTPNAPDSFSYAIALGHQTQGPGLYTNGSSATSNDIWSGTSNIYGGAAQLKTTEAGFDAGMALNPQVRLTSGTMMSDYSVSVSSAAAGGGFFDVFVDITSVTDMTLFDAFDLFWATADCANDVIWGAFETAELPPATSPVPAPASLSLLALGVLLVGRFSRKATGAVVRA